MTKIETMEQLMGWTGLVLFSAEWCHPCKSYRPILEGFAERAGIALGYVDAGKRRDLAGAFAVRAVPTTIYFDKGKEHARRQGAATEPAIALLVP